MFIGAHILIDSIKAAQQTKFEAHNVETKTKQADCDVQPDLNSARVQKKSKSYNGISDGQLVVQIVDQPCCKICRPNSEPVALQTRILKSVALQVACGYMCMLRTVATLVSASQKYACTSGR